MDDGNDVYSGTDTSDRDFWDEGRDEQPGLNWGKCPLCGSEDFSVHSEEKLWALNHLSLSRNGDRLVTAEWGLTEPQWETSTTVGYFTDCCRQELPEGYQNALDEALHNYRDPDA